MVTFWPVAVVSVNPEEVTLVIVPAEPPAAGPDLALEPLPDPNLPALLLTDGEAVALLCGSLLRRGPLAGQAQAAPADVNAPQHEPAPSARP
jgi:hypothetical protein